jgi:hypothetical protein
MRERERVCVLVLGFRFQYAYVCFSHCVSVEVLVGAGVCSYLLLCANMCLLL